MHRESIVLIYRTSFSYVFFSHSVVQHITFCVLYVLEIKVLWKFLVAEMRNCTTELEREDKKNDNQGKIRKKTYNFKFVIIGDPNVGKSCLVHRYTFKKCTYSSHLVKKASDHTLGVEFSTNRLEF